MKNLKNSINKIHNEYIFSIKHDDELDYKNERISFVNNYFDKFEKKFNDLSITTILSFNASDTKIFRTRFGLYDDGVFQSLESVAKRFNISKQAVANKVNRFNDRLRDSVRIELARYVLNLVMQKENKRKTLFFENDIAHIEQLNLSGVLLYKLKNNSHIYSLMDLLNSSERELLSNNICDYEVEKLANLLHSLDLKFMYELSTQELFDKQNSILCIIKSIGFSKYFEEKGSPKYELTMVSELGFDESVSNDLDLFDIVTIKQLLSLSKVQLERIFLAENKRKVFKKLHSLDLYFDFEKKDVSDEVEFEASSDDSAFLVSSSDVSDSLSFDYSEHIVKLNFSTKVYFSLARAGIRTLGDLVNLKRSDLLNIKNIGSKAYNEIVAKVHSLGYCFVDEIVVESNNDVSDSLVDIKSEYDKKLRRLRRIQKQISLLLDEKSKLDFELAELRLNYDKKLGSLKKK